ncbi:MAG: inositol monophosphatase family protein [Myxococcales bacterium]|nr:inositol monophosphatase family protein [Myxococcales bacterium]MDD9966055.1 inositol monophosphatase family protein [Myxococcales bacterium]
MRSTIDTEALTRVALDAAEEAAILIMRGFRSRPATRTKGHEADLVTEFDEAAEQLVRARLAERSSLPVVGEEGGGDLTDAPTWVIDPIDGTTNFAHGHPCFAVSIGLMVAGLPEAGAVVAPALQTRWHGTRAGAFRNGKAIRVSDRANLGQSLLATGFAPNQEPKDASHNLRAFAELLPVARGIRRDGAASLDLCHTADGTFDAYWERGLHAWDVAGGAAIALGAGATITDLAGGPPDYRIGYLAVSNGRIHDALLAHLR